LSFTANHDRLHELKMVTIYNDNNWNIGLTWIFATGANYTPILQTNSDVSGRGNTDVYSTGQRNSATLPNYHRMDINISRKFYIRSLIMDIGLSVYNVYNKQNTIYRTATENRAGIAIRETKMLGFIPALYLQISY